MGPRGLTLPPASTNSAKAFRSAFYCDLCSKGYSRQNEYDAHESSYDHQHKKRLKEMKSMQKQAAPPPNRAREEKGPLVQIKLGGGGAKAGQGSSSSTSEGADGSGAVRKGGFKKGGFKSAFGSVDVPEGQDDKIMQEGVEGEVKEREVEDAAGSDSSDLTDEEDYYDPRKPTDCMPGCKSQTVAVLG